MREKKESLRGWHGGERESPSGISHRSQDSGFSDSEGGRVTYPGISPQQEARRARMRKTSEGSGDSSLWEDVSQLTARFLATPEDVPSPLHSSTPKALNRRHTRSRFPSVNLWLREIRYNYEPECMSTLQSKSLTSDLSKQVSILTAITISSVRMINQRTKSINSEFGDLYSLIGSGNFEDIVSLVNSLIKKITELLSECSAEDRQLDKKTGLETVFTTLNTAICQLDMPKLKAATKALATAFNQRVDHLLLFHIKRLVSVFENNSSRTSLMCVLSGIAGLGLQACYLSDLLARCSGVSALLSLCINTASAPVRSATLRTLATVCCTPSSIMQFERGGGIEIMCDILSDEMRGEAEQCEAASVIAQVTAPWLEHGHTAHSLQSYISPLVLALTRLVKKTVSREMLLLCAAALANISWAEPRSVWPLMDCSSVGILLKAVRCQGPKACVFLKEQAATLLANMSAVAEVRPHLAENRAVPALLCFLQVSHSPLQSPAEVAAAYRVQHKSAIALSRLCSEPEVASQVVQLKGISNLARLCRYEKERNNCDGVLVACLAALRKITANCGRQVIDELNMKDLVDPKLLDSFLLYSSRQDNCI